MSHLSESMIQWLNGLPTNKLSNLGEIFRSTRIAKIILNANGQNPMINKLADQLFKNIPCANLISSRNLRKILMDPSANARCTNILE